MRNRWSRLITPVRQWPWLVRIGTPVGLVGLVAVVAVAGPGPSGLLFGPPLPAASPTVAIVGAIVEPAPLHAAVPPPTTAPVVSPVPTAVPEPTAVVPVRTHTVTAGESVRSVAERYGLRIETLLAANDLANPDLLRIGQTLQVPAADGVLHTLQPGESVRHVAERYGVATGTVVAANGLGDTPDVVASGTVLLVPGATPEVRAPAPQPVAQAASAGAEGAPPRSTAAGSAQAEAAAGEAGGLALKPLVAAPRRVNDAPPPDVTARYVAIVDEASGEVLYGRDEHERVAPASVTKIMTTLVAIEREPNLERRIPVTINGPAMAARDGSSIMGLEPGESVSLKTLLFGMMLPSGNDAAEQVALALGGSRQLFVGWMNEKVAELGLKDTHFVNPSGMDGREHYSSAYDMAMLGRVAMRNESFREMAAAATYRADGYNLKNLNRLIGAYDGADGIKIGSTPRAGKTIVASATRNGHRVYVSLMRSQDLAGDSRALLDWAWRSFEWK